MTQAIKQRSRVRSGDRREAGDSRMQPVPDVLPGRRRVRRGHPARAGDQGLDAGDPDPQCAAFLKGVLNLRGTIVPIVDLRMRFNLKEIEYTPTTVVIVLSLLHEGRERTFGIVVDAVSDVLNIATADIRPKPDFGTVVDADFISGLATVDEQMVMLAGHRPSVASR
jgi:hypothetical protein